MSLVHLNVFRQRKDKELLEIQFECTVLGRDNARKEGIGHKEGGKVHIRHVRTKRHGKNMNSRERDNCMLDERSSFSKGKTIELRHTGRGGRRKIVSCQPSQTDISISISKKESTDTNGQLVHL